MNKKYYYCGKNVARVHTELPVILWYILSILAIIMLLHY